MIEENVPLLLVEDSVLRGNGSNRPEIRMAEEQVRMAESALRLNDAQYKPQVYVGVDGSYSSPGYNFRTDMDPNYVAYAKVSIPVFEWGKRRSEKRASRGQVGMASDQLNRVKDNVALEVQTARLNLLQALEQVKFDGKFVGEGQRK